MSLSARRAWIEIHNAAISNVWVCSSLSARRAWIEIPTLHDILKLLTVALRKESVDRNGFVVHLSVLLMTSLSARRAWIEISWLDFEY